MTENQFVYWLQGFVELNGAPPNNVQWEAIKDHLALVFDKVSPQYQIPSLSNIELKDNPEIKKLLADARGGFMEPPSPSSWTVGPKHKPGAVC